MAASRRPSTSRRQATCSPASTRNMQNSDHRVRGRNVADTPVPAARLLAIRRLVDGPSSDVEPLRRTASQDRDDRGVAGWDTEEARRRGHPFSVPVCPWPRSRSARRGSQPNQSYCWPLRSCPSTLQHTIEHVTDARRPYRRDVIALAAAQLGNSLLNLFDPVAAERRPHFG